MTKDHSISAPPASENMLRLERREGPLPALSLRLAHGEKLGLRGVNGSGKTTLLEHLAGLRITPNIETHATPGPRTAYLPQHPPRPLGWPLSVRDYARLAGLPESALPARLRPLLNTRCDALSGGQFQQLALAAALSGMVQGSAPDLILLDEPTHHLDRDGLDWLSEALRAVPAACLLVSHDRDWLETHADRILELPAPGDERGTPE
ncbi:MAG: ATP-binding cassette domain-containing protein [Pseudomonadota bacterium]